MAWPSLPIIPRADCHHHQHLRLPRSQQETESLKENPGCDRTENQRQTARRVVVAGCLVQRHKTKLLNDAPGIDRLVGVFDREHIVEEP